MCARQRESKIWKGVAGETVVFIQRKRWQEGGMDGWMDEKRKEHVLCLCLPGGSPPLPFLVCVHGVDDVCVCRGVDSPKGQ